MCYTAWVTIARDVKVHDAITHLQQPEEGFLRVLQTVLALEGFLLRFYSNYLCRPGLLVATHLPRLA